MRSANIDRVTNETSIHLVLNLDGVGKGVINTSIPFFDHMLNQLTFHSLVDLEISAKEMWKLTVIIRWKTVVFA